jgi:hypothetical protein
MKATGWATETLYEAAMHVRRSRGSSDQHNADARGRPGEGMRWHVSARSFAGATSLNWPVGLASVSLAPS